ncbi:MAG: methyltransferase, FxLD system, partial [Pseudonocardia sp.]|nr:methyltransferase, FxLD system [Pseudonocardia sp.]
MTRWRQLSLWCADWRTAERIAVTCLDPTVSAAQERGDLAGWWFVRKGPSWRLRVQPADDIDGNVVVGDVAEALRRSGHVRHVAELVYEPETAAFGGPAAMTAAHELFAADSRHVLNHLARTRGRNDHRRELGVLLAGRLLRAAGLDWYEQGDVWHRLAAHRAPTERPTPTPATVNAVGKLLTAVNDTTSSPLHEVPEWPAAHEQAGRALTQIAHSGRLDRGMRAVLAHHLLFTFNRLGISAEDQYVLAASASHFVLQENHHMTPTHSTEPVSDIATAPGSPTAAQLRDGLADYIRGRGTFRSAAVERAFRTVPRHLFLPDVDLAEAYAPRPVITKRAPNGTALSSASSPNLVADMLELLDARPGHQVLEIGAATGINAALLAEIVGPDGHVVTVEIDHDLTEEARTALDTAGYGHVEVHCADGALGHPSGGPYDRIIVTAGAWNIPATWWEQLAPAGRLVVP